MAGMYNLTTRIVGGLINLFSPSSAARYAHGRAAYRMLSRRGYAAAGGSGPNQLWTPVDRAAETEIQAAAPKVRARARDLERNHPNLSGAIGTIIHNVIGPGIMPQADIRRPDGNPDDAANEQIEEIWTRWSDDGCDLSGELSFPEIEELTLRQCIVDGEIFHHYVALDYLPGSVAMRLEPIESDQVDTAVMADNVINGIEYNAFMAKTAFHVLDGRSMLNSYAHQSRRIPAAEMLHVYHKRRASQYRGISWLAPVVMRLYDLSEYEDYEMIGAKLAAAFGVFIETPFSDMPSRYMSDKTAGDDESSLEYIEPGLIKRLMPGEKISVASHNRPGTNYDPFVAAGLRASASGLNISYEAMSKDYRSASYSSARAASLEERRFYRWCQQMLIRKLCTPVYRKVVETAVLSGAFRAPGYQKDPQRYFRVKWQTPGWEWIDPLKDSKAAAQELELGIVSRRQLAWQRGRDLDMILAQLAAERDQMEALGIGVADTQGNGGSNANNAAQSPGLSAVS